MFHKASPKHVEYNILATLPHIQSTCSLASFRPYASAWKMKEERLYGRWFLIGWKDRFVWHQLVAKIPSSLMFWVSRTSDKSTRTLTDNDDGESNESYRNRTNLPPSSNTTCPLTERRVIALKPTKVCDISLCWIHHSWTIADLSDSGSPPCLTAAKKGKGREGMQLLHSV